MWFYLLPINSQCNFQRAPIATASHKFFIRQINIRTIKQVGNLALLPLTGWNTIISLMAWTWCTICAPLISRDLAVLSSKLRRYHLLECAIFLHLVLDLLGNEQFNSDANTISPLIGILIGCQRSEVKRSLPWNFPPSGHSAILRLIPMVWDWTFKIVSGLKTPRVLSHRQHQQSGQFSWARMIYKKR